MTERVCIAESYTRMVVGNVTHHTWIYQYSDGTSERVKKKETAGDREK